MVPRASVAWNLTSASDRSTFPWPSSAPTTHSRGVLQTLRAIVTPHGRAHGNSDSGSPGGSPGGSPDGSPGGSPDGSPGGSHGGSPGASHAASHVDAPWRVGDSIVHPDVDGSPEPPAEVYARAFIDFLQKHPALQELLGGWISSRALWRKYYPAFLATIANAGLPWRTTAAPLGRVTERRERQMMLTRRGKRRRCTVVEYLIPRP
jgi:hypothetical protein